ncbi:signal peptide peptidase SppA [Haematospirillum sp. H1815]|uniref:signal peptide peptidase SppA n=1 Tax=Haematospirillum sp. H1815 TaxID=2723108 RepID=UPI00143A98DC|nr:signal peptide peptidase SppA [Haematospirillum sp. H1815]NKD76634.1 signal peptide peptidase SppA [Haematospirillum sp. H1815]
MRIFGRALLWALALCGVVFVSLSVVLVLGVSRLGPSFSRSADLPSEMILSLSLDYPTPELPEVHLDHLFEPQVSLVDIVTVLDRAAADPRVKAVTARIGDAGRGMAEAQELRDAIARFRASGKPAFAFAETLGQSNGGGAEYLLASGFSEIWLQPSGTLGLTGFGVEVPFLKSALEKIGIEHEFASRWEYKTAMDSLVRDDMSEPHRASLRALLDSWQSQLLDAVVSGRGIERASVEALAARPPLFASEAKDAGLVDTIGYLDEFMDAVHSAAGTDKEVSLDDYLAGAIAPPSPHASRIALIHGVGVIHAGASEDGTMSGTHSIGSDTVAGAIRSAVDDPDIKAIVLRINSPGGDAVASDTIWREVARAKEKGIPLVVSMGEYAASGGYFLSMPAHAIVANPGTITGSIGVFSGKTVVSGLWDKLGVSWARVETGSGALMLSPNRKFTPEERAWFDRSLDAIYTDFTGKLAQGRGLAPDQVDHVARGRVWSGHDAKAVGLVDALGGFGTAVRLAREAAGISEDAEIELVPFPAPKTEWEQILAVFGGSAHGMRQLSYLGTLEPIVKPFVSGIERQRAIGRSPAVLMAPSSEGF